MRITKIEQQKKRRNRYSVYIDDSFAFGVSEGQLLELGLSAGQELTQGERERLEAEATSGLAYERALNYLGIRPRSEKEMREYLYRKQYTQSVIDDAILKLRERKLLDDAQFARDWVSWRQATTPRSRRRLAAELRQKGVGRELIDNAMTAIDEDVEIQQVQQIIQKRSHRYSDREKLMAYLSRQGYGYDIIRRAMEAEDGSISS